MSNFRVGQKVVCINNASDPERLGWYPGSQPQTKTIYTVRSLGWTALCASQGMKLEEIILHIASIRNGKYQIEHADSFYRANRFRPLVTKKENLKQRQEIFNSILNSVNGREERV